MRLIRIDLDSALLFRWDPGMNPLNVVMHDPRMTDEDLLWSGRQSEMFVSTTCCHRHEKKTLRGHCCGSSLSSQRSNRTSLLESTRKWKGHYISFPSTLCSPFVSYLLHWIGKFTMTQQVPLVFSEAINVSRATAIFWLPQYSPT